MKVNDYRSEWSAEFNAGVMAGVEKLVCKYRRFLPHGWRMGAEFQDDNEGKPSYLLDLESNHGGGAFAPIKMRMLKACPGICATGTATIEDIYEALHDLSLSDDSPELRALRERCKNCEDISCLAQEDWNNLRQFGITKWYGGIRIPYDILVTEHDAETGEQTTRNVKGEIRIVFSGAKEWQDVFFALLIFKEIQKLLRTEWPMDQIWYNLRELKKDVVVGFWCKNLKVKELA